MKNCRNKNKSESFSHLTFLIINISDVTSTCSEMTANLNLSTNFSEIICEILFRDLVQCFVIEENRSCIILLY